MGEEYLEFSTEHLIECKNNYAKIYVDSWVNLSLTKGQIPGPQGKAKEEILNGLVKIYDS